MGYKTWTRERLTAADLQEHIQDQTILRFASAAQRTSLLPAPEEGMVSYLEDVNRWEGHDGTAWRVLTYGAAPILRVRRVAVQSIPVSGFHNILWDSVTEDTHAMMSGAAITCKRAGLYAVTFGVSLSTSLGGRRAVRIMKQTGAATPVETGIGRMTIGAAAGDIGVEASGLMRLELNDALLTQTYHDGSGAQNTGNADYSPTKLDLMWIAA